MRQAEPAEHNTVEAPNSVPAATSDNLNDDCDSMDSLDIYPHQVGGHHILIKHPTHPELIVKPIIAKELEFYREAQNYPIILQVMSKFYGIIKLHVPGDCLILEDLTFGMKEPSVLDMKIGRRLYDEDASPEKAARMIRKSAGSTSGKIGFRISGMRYLDPETGNIVIKLKRDVRGMKMDDLCPSLLNFFNGLDSTNAVTLIENYMRRLSLIRKVVLGSNALFYSSSILFVYDQDDSSRWDCRMIDFVHSKIYPPESGQVIDENYLEGLANLAEYFTRIREMVAQIAG